MLYSWLHLIALIVYLGAVIGLAVLTTAALRRAVVIEYGDEQFPPEVLILYAPAGLERLIAEAGIADPENPQASRRAAIRSIEDAATLKAAARAYGVDYVDVAASGSK